MSEAPHLQTNRLDWVDTARGAAILLVILHHAVLFSAAAGLASNAWDLVNESMRLLRMPLFFFLSGMLSTNALRKTPKALMTGRIGTNLWLYVLWATVAYIIFSIIPYARDGAPDGFLRWIVATFLLPQNGAWYLLALAIFLILARLSRQIPTIPLLLTAGTISALAGPGLVNESSFVWNNVMSLFVFFLAGTRLRETATASAVMMGRPLIAVPLVAVIGSSAVAATSIGAVEWPGVRFALGCAAVLAGLAVASLLAPTRLGILLGRLGRNTLPIYVMHEIILGLLAIPLTHFAGSHLDQAARWLAPALLVLVAVTVAAALRTSLMKVPGALTAPWSWRTAKRSGDESIQPSPTVRANSTTGD